ncbi:MAG: hypothetical protein RIG61_06520 [Deltaproteobacteria bacterium]
MFLEKEILDKIEFEDCDTQKFLYRYGRPDLIISNVDVEIIFEIKISSVTLTNNQPKSYLEYLNKCNQNTKWLVFLIPKDYRHKELWGKGMPGEIKKEEWRKRTPIVLPNSNVKTQKLYWNDIIEQLEKHELPSVNQYFNDFVNILKSWFERMPIIFTNSEVKLMFSDQIPQVITKLFKIVDDLRDDLTIEFGNKIKIRRPLSNNEEYSIYIQDDNNQELLYFGVWYQFWGKYGKPLCYGVDGNEYDNTIVNTFRHSEKEVIEEDGWICSWIDENLIRNEDCQKDISSLMIKKVYDLLEAIQN